MDPLGQLTKLSNNLHRVSFLVAFPLFNRLILTELLDNRKIKNEQRHWIWISVVFQSILIVQRVNAM